MSNWKTAYRSFYYQNAPEPEDIKLLREIRDQLKTKNS